MEVNSIKTLVNVLKAFIDNRIMSIARSIDYRFDNLRIDADHLKANSITSRHLTLSAKNSIPTLNRNYLLGSDEQALSSSYLIAEYTASELINDLDYTFVIYGLVNSGQQIMVSFNNGTEGEYKASFDSSGYATIHAHTPLTIENENVQFYNYPESTATSGAIGWACMYRGYVKNPPRTWNIAPEDSGQRIGDAESSIDYLGDEITQRVRVGDLEKYLKFRADTGLLIGEENNPLQVQITNEKISFLQTNGVTDSETGELIYNEVAYITGSKLYITSAQILESLQVGNYLIAKTSDGGMVFK